MVVTLTLVRWFLDLTAGDVFESPPISDVRGDPLDSDDEETEFRGWGVLAIHVDAFKLVRT